MEEEQKQTIQTLENEHLQLKETIQEQQARPAEDLMKNNNIGVNLGIAPFPFLLKID